MPIVKLKFANCNENNKDVIEIVFQIVSHITEIDSRKDSKSKAFYTSAS